jgi:hypothetical protein
MIVRRVLRAMKISVARWYPQVPISVTIVQKTQSPKGAV